MMVQGRGCGHLSLGASKFMIWTKMEVEFYGSHVIIVIHFAHLQVKTFLYVYIYIFLYTHLYTHNCYLLCFFTGKDNKENAYFRMGPLFMWAEKLSNTGGKSLNGIFYPCKVQFPVDLKAAWQMAGMGGSSGTTNLFCFLCDQCRCDKGALVDACKDCRERLNKTQCRHMPFNDRVNSPNLISENAFTWLVPDYPIPKEANKKDCNKFLLLTNPSHKDLPLAVSRTTLDQWLQTYRVKLSGGNYFYMRTDYENTFYLFLYYACSWSYNHEMALLV
jgi:hypothetical protein